MATTRTLGMILRPRFVPNLTLSVDWYDIRLKDAINTAAPQTAADLCVDLPTLDNDFCRLFDREAGTGAIVDFVQRPLNVAEFTTEGYDFTVNYLLDPAEWGVQRNLGLFNLRLVGNHLKDLTFVNLPNADPDPDRGEEDAPERQYKLDVSWQYGRFLANYGFSYFAETQRYARQVRTANPDIADRRYWDYKAREVQDLYLAWEARSGMTVYTGVNNLTNEKPDIGQIFYPVSAVGRFFYLGLDVDLALLR